MFPHRTFRGLPSGRLFLPVQPGSRRRHLATDWPWCRRNRPNHRISVRRAVRSWEWLSVYRPRRLCIIPAGYSFLLRVHPLPVGKPWNGYVRYRILREIRGKHPADCFHTPVRRLTRRRHSDASPCHVISYGYFRGRCLIVNNRNYGGRRRWHRRLFLKFPAGAFLPVGLRCHSHSLP